MLEEMTTALDNLFKVPKEYITFDSGEVYNLFVTLTATKIELEYLILRAVNSNINFLNTIKESFEGEVQYIDEFERDTKKKDMYLYDILLDEVLSNEPNSHNVIELLKRNYIIIKKGKDLDELWNTLDLMKTLTGEGRRKSLFRMKVFNKVRLKTPTFFNFTKQINNFINDDSISITRLTLYKDIVNVVVKNISKLDFDELMIATSFDEKEVARLLRGKRKDFKNAAQKHPILKGLKYNFDDAELFVIEDWFKEMCQNQTKYLIRPRFAGLMSSETLKINRLIIGDAYHKNPDTFVMNPNFKYFLLDELLEKLMKIVEERKIKVS